MKMYIAIAWKLPSKSPEIAHITKVTMCRYVNGPNLTQKYRYFLPFYFELPGHMGRHWFLRCIQWFWGSKSLGGSGGRRILILPVTVAPTDPTRLEGSSFPDDGVQMASRVAITRNDQRTARNGERKFWVEDCKMISEFSNPPSIQSLCKALGVAE